MAQDHANNALGSWKCESVDWASTTHATGPTEAADHILKRYNCFDSDFLNALGRLIGLQVGLFLMQQTNQDSV